MANRLGPNRDRRPYLISAGATSFMFCISLPIALAGLVLAPQSEPGTAALAVLLVPAIVGAIRGAAISVSVGPDGCVIRNTFRSYRFRPADLVAVGVAPPGLLPARYDFLRFDMAPAGAAPIRAMALGSADLRVVLQVLSDECGWTPNR